MSGEVTFSVSFSAPKKERVYFILQLVVHHPGESEEELEAGPGGSNGSVLWKSAAYELSSQALLRLLPSTIEDHPPGGGDTHRSLIQKIPYVLPGSNPTVERCRTSPSAKDKSNIASPSRGSEKTFEDQVERV